MGDPWVDLSLVELIDKGLYDRGDNEIRNIPEEWAMRYMAVCTSVLLDRVDDLGGFQMDVGPRVHNLEQVTSSLMSHQDKLNNKVNVLSFDWNLNLKYHARVVDFEAKMLSFSLNKLVLVHEDWAQSNQLVQDQFGLHQDWVALTEETLRSLKTKVRASSGEVVLTFAEGSLIGFRS